MFKGESQGNAELYPVSLIFDWEPNNYCSEVGDDDFVGYKADLASEEMKIYKAVHDELIERFTGEMIIEGALFIEPVILRTWFEYRAFAKRWGCSHMKEFSGGKFFTKDKVTSITVGMIKILVLRSTGNLRYGEVLNSPVFVAMAKAIGLIFDQKGDLIETTEKFEMFLQRHRIT